LPAECDFRRGQKTERLGIVHLHFEAGLRVGRQCRGLLVAGDGVVPALLTPRRGRGLENLPGARRHADGLSGRRIRIPGTASRLAASQLRTLFFIG